jgi:hypothetical protein
MAGLYKRRRRRLAHHMIRTGITYTGVAPQRKEGLSARLQRRPRKQVPPNEGKIVQIIQNPNHAARMMTREQAEVGVVTR